MDYFRRLTLGVSLLILGSVCCAEDYPAVRLWSYSGGPANGIECGGIAGVVAEKLAAYPAGGGYVKTGTTREVSGNSCASATDVLYYQAELSYTATGAKSWATLVQFTGAYMCLGGGTYNSTSKMCVGATPCPSGTIRSSSGACVADQCGPKKGTSSSSGYYDIGTSPSGSFANVACSGGCSVTFSGSMPVARSLVNGTYHYYGQGSFSFDGSSCTASSSNVPASASAAPAPDSCGAGQTMGQVNGSTVCVGSNGSPANPNGPKPSTTTGTTKTTVTNPDGSTTVTTVTTNPDGSKSTNITTTNPGTGNVTSQTTNDPAPSADPMDDFCKTNPNSPMCKKKSDMANFCTDNPTANICKTTKFCEDNPDISICKKSVWQGACGAFNCDGDAIQCAIARDQYERNCTLFDKATSDSDLGKQVAAGNDPQAGSFPKPSNAENIDVTAKMGTYTSQTWLSRGALPTPSISALGHSYTFDTSLLSALFEAIGYVMVAVSGVVGARIIGGA